MNKAQSRLSGGKVSSLTRSRSNRSVGLSSIHEEEDEVSASSFTAVQLPPRIRCQYDVIWSFLDEFLDIIIQDYQVIESKPPEPECLIHLSDSESKSVYMKNYQDIGEQDLDSAEVMSVNGADVILKRKTSRKSAASWNPSPRVSTQKISNTNNNNNKTMKVSKSMDDVMKAKKSLEKKSSSRSIQIPSNRSSTTVISSEDEVKNVRITFKNGNVYEGQAVGNKMCGHGQFLWSDGTFYEGEFKDGLPNGQGDMILPDLSRYVGGFRNGLYHGEGVLNVAGTPKIYSGGWRDNEKHNQGWLLYGPNNWYDGGWYEDKKEGFGFRRYENGARYNGNHHMGNRHGEGCMIWSNNDYYKGEWVNDKFDGYGEYVWRAFFNRAFVFPLHNVYKGHWSNGERSGKGLLYFGNGAKLQGTFDKNLKHGDCTIYSGNGQVVRQIFRHDKRVQYVSSIDTVQSSSSASSSPGIPIFSIPEQVNVGYYIDQILDKIKDANISPQSLERLKRFEETGVRNTIALYLPQLTDLYKTYAVLYANDDEPVNFKPVMVRMILWQLYKDLGVSTAHRMSILDTDKILSENPASCVESAHYPFEHIQFWQFLMSLIGMAFKTRNWNDVIDDDIEGSVLALVLEQFFTELLVKLPLKKGSSLSFKYKNLIPIQNVYQLYQTLGDPPTARAFLCSTCLRKGQKPMCYMEHNPFRKIQTRATYGENIIPIYEKISFKDFPPPEMTEVDNKNSWTEDDSWQNLIEFRYLGTGSVLKCLLEASPAIMEDGLLSNINYPLSFLEFYDALLYCIFLVIERELAWAKKCLPDIKAARETAVSEVKPEEMDKNKKKGKGKKK